jgi:hypothetical protein
MSGDATPNLDLQYLDPSQAQPEVKINDAWNKIDAAIADAGGSITVEQSGDSPGITAVRKLVFTGGATVTELSAGVAEVSSGEGSSESLPPFVIQLACSDLVTALATAASVAYVRAPHSFTVTAVRSSLLTASSSGPVTVAIKNNGTDILSTDLSIDATELTSVTAATPAVIASPDFADDDLITIDITAAGTAAKGLIVMLLGHV